MKTSIEPLEGNKVKLSVEVDEAEFDKAVDAAFKRIAREVRIPGFRPGKAPRRLLEARLGNEAARDEALRGSLPEFYAKAVREHEVDVIAPPEIDITAGQETGPVAFDAIVEVRPQVNVGGYGGLRVTVPGPAPTDEEIDKQVDRLREQFGELRVVGRPARDGDHLTIDLHGYRHSEAIEGLTADDFLYELGSGTIVPKLDEELQGKTAGDILKFNAEIPGEEGPEEITFQVLVKEVKEKLLPDVTDEWASEASEFETVEELRASITERIGQVKKLQAMLGLREGTVGALVELVDEEVPEPLVNEELERRLHDLGHRLESQHATLAQYLEATGRSQEDLVNELRAAAVQAVKADLALRAVADAEGIEITDDDIDTELAGMAEQADMKPAQLRRRLEQNDQLPTVRSDLRKSRALTWLLEHVEIVDEAGQPIDRSELLTPPAEVVGGEEPTQESTE